jgi:hypothetical protein
VDAGIDRSQGNGEHTVDGSQGAIQGQLANKAGVGREFRELLVAA